MAELSATSGVAIPTIKYYLREGLVPAGVRTAANQASYGEGHVRRLRLVRALVEVGNLPIATVAAVLAAVDDQTRSTREVLGVVHHALAIGDGHPTEGSDVDAAVDEIEAFLTELGWRVSPRGPAIRELARVLASLRRLGWDVDAAVFRRYAEAADRVAAAELEHTAGQERRTDAVETAVVGTVLFEAALVALRRLAQEHHSAAGFERPDPSRRRRQGQAG